ncbi:MAG: ankyrin repeat domain-containing protein [Candidatus Eremiobacteraeota bacterium]|nr:ankyrin repeat domain-containing protein [Candidatus Eremiobacteraeota bacterium]
MNKFRMTACNSGAFVDVVRLLVPSSMQRNNTRGQCALLWASPENRFVRRKDLAEIPL